MAKEAGVQVVQRTEISGQPSNINGVSWSEDNRLAVVTNGCVAIISIKGVSKDVKKKVSKLKINRNIIPAETTIQEYDVDLAFSDLNPGSLPLFSESPYHSTCTLDPALSSCILKTLKSQDVTFAKWSPVGCDRIGRSVLAVLFRTNKLALFAMAKISAKWNEVADLTASHYAQLKKENFFVNNKIMKGKPPADARTVVNTKGNWRGFHEWQRRKYLLHFTCVEWYPVAVICANKVNRTSSKFVLLATTVKSGQLFLWKGKMPLLDSTTALNRVLAVNTLMFYPCTLAWSTVTTSGACYLACGNSEGIVKVFFIKISTTSEGILVISFVKAYTFVGSRDDRSVDCLAWHVKEDKVFLACSKGPHIYVFHSQLMKEGNLSSPAEQIITGVHLLNVTALTITSSGTLYSSSAEGTVQYFKLGTGQRTAVLQCDTPSTFGCVGIAASPNCVFIALLENKRKLLTGKIERAGGNCQIALVSLITEEENDKIMASWKARPSTDVSHMWDHFFFRELYSQESGEDSISSPETLSGLSQSQLQSMRNFAPRPRREPVPKMRPQKLKYETEIAEIMNREGSNRMVVPPDVEMAFENGDSSPESLVLIDRIEKAIADLAMQNVLTTFLRYREENNITSRDFVGEPLIWGICYRLAVQQNPTESVVKLLEKAWLVCNPGIWVRQETENAKVSINICDEILTSKKSYEKCMCDEPIMLQEHRSGRCAAGHVWPRCCVTFKLLDGANCRICENCYSHALIQNPSGNSQLDWTKALLMDNISCTYCGGWFEYVS